MINNWEKNLSYALKFLNNARLKNTQWTFGGGTVLKYLYEHRLSKDIDIFFNDRQLMSYVSPRTNDIMEDKIIKYTEQENFIKIYLPNCEIDFILARKISDFPVIQTTIINKNIFIEAPTEIIAKKIFYRFDSFTPRDFFDLAFVYTQEKENILSLSKQLYFEILKIKKDFNNQFYQEDFKNFLNKVEVLNNGKSTLQNINNILNEFFDEVEKLVKTSQEENLVQPT